MTSEKWIRNVISTYYIMETTCPIRVSKFSKQVIKKWGNIRDIEWSSGSDQALQWGISFDTLHIDWMEEDCSFDKESQNKYLIITSCLKLILIATTSIILRGIRTWLLLRFVKRVILKIMYWWKSTDNDRLLRPHGTRIYSLYQYSPSRIGKHLL